MPVAQENNVTTDSNTRSGNDFGEVLKILHNEWKFRLSQYWSITIKMSIMFFVITLLPFMYSSWGADVSLLHIPIYVFPILGAIFSAVVAFFSIKEMDKINVLKESIKNFIAEEYPVFFGLPKA